MSNRAGAAGKAKTASTSADFTPHNASQELSVEMTQAILERAAKRRLRKEEKEKKIEELKNEVCLLQVLGFVGQSSFVRPRATKNSKKGFTKKLPSCITKQLMNMEPKHSYIQILPLRI